MSEQDSAFESVYANWLAACDEQAFQSIENVVNDDSGNGAGSKSSGSVHRPIHWPRVHRLPALMGVVLLFAGGCIGFVLQPLTHLMPQANGTNSSTAASMSQPMSSTGGMGPGRLVVDVQGDVRRPGLVRLNANARVLDAVSAAGGFLHPQDAQLVNLAAPVDDGAEVVVPSPRADRQPSSPPGNQTSQQTIDLNVADAVSLETIPGIGPAKAQAIIQYRQQHGRFQTISDLLNVPGIGQATLTRLSPFLSVSGQK